MSAEKASSKAKIQPASPAAANPGAPPLDTDSLLAKVAPLAADARSEPLGVVIRRRCHREPFSQRGSLLLPHRNARRRENAISVETRSIDEACTAWKLLSGRGDSTAHTDPRAARTVHFQQ